MVQPLNIPAPQSPIVDPTTGILSREWWYWFQKVYQRTGAATGGDFGPVAPVTLTASPMTYTATAGGTLIVSGAGMIRMEISTDGAAWYSTGHWYGAFPLNATSQARLTYIGAPVVTFIPG